MKIFYGIPQSYIDITEIAMKNYLQGNFIILPKRDHEMANIFTDPRLGKIKHVLVIYDNDEQRIYRNNNVKKIPLELSEENDVVNNIKTLWNSNGKSIPDAAQRLSFIHNNCDFYHGNHSEEYPEQLMVVNFLSPDSVVLELGGNIGRNSLVIATILSDDKNLVVLETDPVSCQMLTDNRDGNDLKFHIENSALSERKLIQRGWDTIPSDDLRDGYNFVNTITYDKLKEKYALDFNTLVVDCEGALYYILQDNVSILNNIKMIIMENDYNVLSHKQTIDQTLIEHGFKIIYTESGGWGPCFNNFYEVWGK